MGCCCCKSVQKNIVRENPNPEANHNPNPNHNNALHDPLIENKAEVESGQRDESKTEAKPEPDSEPEELIFEMELNGETISTY